MFEFPKGHFTVVMHCRIFVFMLIGQLNCSATVLANIGNWAPIPLKLDSADYGVASLICVLLHLLCVILEAIRLASVYLPWCRKSHLCIVNDGI